MIVQMNGDLKIKCDEVIDTAYQRGYEDGKKAYMVDTINQSDFSYQRGLEQAWECGKRIASETSVVLSKIFGEVYPSAVFQQYSPQEAMQKIKEYEECQTEKTTIKIWGEDKPFTVCNEDAISRQNIIDTLVEPQESEERSDKE